LEAEMIQKMREALWALQNRYREQANTYAHDSVQHHRHHDEADAVQAAIHTIEKVWKDSPTLPESAFRKPSEVQELTRQRIINIILQQPIHDATTASYRARLVCVIRNDGIEPEPGHLEKIDPREANAEVFAKVLNDLVDAVEELRQAWSRRFEP
jgi:hypothetical protein